MELTEPQPIRPVNDQCIDGRHVNTRFDDCGADEHVVVALPEVVDDLLEEALVHLPMGDRYARVGYQVMDLFGLPIDVSHAVVHIEDLALTQEFAAYGLGHGAVVVLSHVGEDGLAVGRRGVQQGEVTDARQRHLQRARDGRGRKREDVDVLLQVLDRLLVGDAEALLLIDHQQTELRERDVVGQ